MHRHRLHEDMDIDMSPQQNNTPTGQLNAPMRDHTSAEYNQNGSIDEDNEEDFEFDLFARDLYEEHEDADIMADADADYMRGGEGAEEHLIRIGRHGLIEFRIIFESLARHDECTCHTGVERPIADARVRDANNVHSAVNTPGSTAAQHGSEFQSLESSLYISRAETPLSASALLSHIGAHAQGYYFTGRPLPLIEEAPRGMVRSTVSTYPDDISLDESGSSNAEGNHERPT